MDDIEELRRQVMEASKNHYREKRKRSVMFSVRRPMRLLFPLVLLAALSPAQSRAGGFYTAPANPVYNFGPESAWMNPAGMTGVKTATISFRV